MTTPTTWHIDSCASTQAVMREWLSEPERSPGQIGVLTTDKQLEGIGREGRRWEQGPGANLLCSIGVVGPLDGGVVDGLPLRVARGVAALLNSLASEERIAVKHPNDLVVDGRKVAGVLADAHHVGDKVSWVCVGVGINLGGEEFTAGDRAATTVQATLGIVPEAEPLTRGIAGVVTEEVDVSAPRWS